MNSLYETDYYAWTRQQAALLRDGKAHALDWAHLAEEIDELGASKLQALESHLRVLLAHLLKLQHGTPLDLARAGRGWRNTCRAQRHDIATLLRRNRTLRHELAAALAESYPTARLDASTSLDCEVDLLPQQCPWEGETQVLREDFLPA
jgi:Domain of unknown function DUF29